MYNFQYLKFSFDLEQNLIQTKSCQIFNNEKISHEFFICDDLKGIK